jgi:two-component system, sensor histidine kinase LadS
LQTQKRMESIEREVATLQERVLTDPLTRLANRTQFDAFFEEQFKRAYTQRRPLALVFIDLDHFKNVNDTYGHPAGDEVLRRVGKVLRASVRNIDMVARYGGEEFAVVLTETDLDAAALRAEAIRKRLQNETIVFDGKTIPVTLSAGVAGTERGRVFASAAQLTNAADRAVYAAKAAGRNCVRVFKPQQPAIHAPVDQAPAAASAPS